ncbi:NAD-dependent epimerase/dehydratase family protein [Bradyrhizobium cenepequi]|uniref:NAD-dependent epimerase/dehydratase family protein n=1 Tax=Bradyrhizobium cenepequi TaxID=2821403 RepID=UPI001CE306FA|nr:NAD-dependent epimerase/dehydratase family protein [Bradyrhizobium cenepequi]MCA6112785.1 NAD-dependent epimerase/dehydratase family protein [Bradyrhizobium cenepequi]
MAVPQTDLDLVLKHASADLRALAGARIFITGGTGYIGRWLLEALLHADRALSLGLSITVLSRDPDGFAATHPYLGADPAVKLIAGDVRDFLFPPGSFTHAIHGATDVIATAAPLHTFDVTVGGTRRLLDFCREAGITDVLLLSSGAIYGPIPAHIDLVCEDYLGAPDPSVVGAAYGLGKRAAEWLGTAYGAEAGLSCKSARVFAQIGPYLALDRQFAAGNFIRDAILRQPIVIRGDGTPLRSYMYAVDLVIWLLAILLRGLPSRAYNVGSDQPVSIASLATAIARAAGLAQPAIEIQSAPQADRPPERYVPSIARACDELGLSIRIPFDAALDRTIEWYRPRLLEAQHP